MHKERDTNGTYPNDHLERIDQTEGLNRGYGSEDDDSHRAGSDQRRRSEGQKHARASLHGDNHSQTPRSDKKSPVESNNVLAH